MKNIAVISAWVGPIPKYVLLARQNHRQFCEKHGYDYLWFEESEIVAFMGGRPLTGPSIWWLKPYLIRRAMDMGYAYVFWTDTDSLFVNQAISLDDLALIESSFIFTGDSWDLCSAGHLWFKTNEFSREFLTRWLSWRHQIVDRLQTTHQNIDGTLGDQPALNIMLHGGFDARYEDASLLFNQVNGYEGNHLRAHKYYRWTHSPASKLGTLRAKFLIHPTLRKECKVIEQARMNAYPFRLLPGKRASKKSPIVHFPGQSKSLMPQFIMDAG